MSQRSPRALHLLVNNVLFYSERLFQVLILNDVKTCISLQRIALILTSRSNIRLVKLITKKFPLFQITTHRIT